MLIVLNPQNILGPPKARGFTLLELLVVLGVITVLIIVQLPVLAEAKASRKSPCVRAMSGRSRCPARFMPMTMATACQSWARCWQQLAVGFASERGQRPPKQRRANEHLLLSGNRAEIYGRPELGGAKLNSLGVWPSCNSFHIIGYSLAFSGSGSLLNSTNQNTTILPEAVANFPSPGTSTIYPASERVLVADADPQHRLGTAGLCHPENNYICHCRRLPATMA